MTRSVSYRHEISELVNWNQIKASNETFFLLREIGPVGFVVQECQEKKYKVCLGDPHTCSCKEFKKTKDLCKHICWILLKRFRLDRDDPISWQLGLVEREINDLIFHKNKKNAKIIKINQEEIEGTSPDKSVSQRKIETDDICPICQEDLMNSSKMVTFCRNGCGNNIHIKCMAVWTEHKKKELSLKMQDIVPCPICRGEFATMHLLMVEMNNSKEGRFIKSKATLQVKQMGLDCSNCNLSPIIGKAYKCKYCLTLYLCGNCFNNWIHNQHEFVYREHSNGKWLDAPHSRGIPAKLINGLETNDLESYDYNLLQQLEKPADTSTLRQKDINQFSNWTISAKSKLCQPGHQCRICLMSYKQGDFVRKLPRCQHIFHSSCIDPWLLHRSAHCPIDDVEVTRLSLNSSSSNRDKQEKSNILNGRNNQSVNYNLQKFGEKNIAGDFKNPIDLTSALTIGTMNCRPFSGSDHFKNQPNSFGSLLKSAINRPRQLPPITKPANYHFDSSISIISIRKPQNATHD